MNDSRAAALWYAFKYMLKTGNVDPDFDWDIWTAPGYADTFQMDET